MIQETTRLQEESSVNRMNSEQSENEVCFIYLSIYLPNSLDKYLMSQFLFILLSDLIRQ